MDFWLLKRCCASKYFTAWWWKVILCCLIGRIPWCCCSNGFSVSSTLGDCVTLVGCITSIGIGSTLGNDGAFLVVDYAVVDGGNTTLGSVTGGSGAGGGSVKSFKVYATCISCCQTWSCWCWLGEEWNYIDDWLMKKIFRIDCKKLDMFGGKWNSICISCSTCCKKKQLTHR